MNRIQAIDALRGCALLGMFAFHLTWDLGFYGFVPATFPFSPPVMGFGHVVALTFLALVGASLVLASRDGMNWRGYSRRLAQIVAACAAITLVTFYVFPDSFIFFGILHCIAVMSVLALAFLRGPLWLVFGAAALMAAAPFVAASPALDNYLGWSLGLSAHEPRTNDWRPLMPWGAATLAGLGAMRLLLERGLPVVLATWAAGGRFARALVWGGRHSLLVYLVHQPIFIGAVALAAFAAGPRGEPPPLPEDLQFQENCEHACQAAGADLSLCRSLCGCVLDRSRSEGLWRPMVENRMTPAQQRRFDQLTRACAPAALPKSE